MSTKELSISNEGAGEVIGGGGSNDKENRPTMEGLSNGFTGG